MKGSFFDDLARTLATPMPRRRALRLAAGLVVVAAVPGVSPRSAGASSTRSEAGCPAGGLRSCEQQFPGRGIPHCCPDYRPGFAICCKSADECFNNNENCCPKVNQCGNRCCLPDEVCKGGQCVDCPRCKDGSCCPRSKGRCVNGKCCPAIRTTRAASGRRVACCPPGTIAVPGARALCCRKGDLDCCDKYDVRKGDDELGPLGPGKGKLCVKGKIKNA